MQAGSSGPLAEEGGGAAEGGGASSRGGRKRGSSTRSDNVKKRAKSRHTKILKLVSHPEHSSWFVAWSHRTNIFASGAPHLRDFVRDPDGLKSLLQHGRPRFEASQEGVSKQALVHAFKGPVDAFGSKMLDTSALRKLLRSAKFVENFCKKWENGEGEEVPAHMKGQRCLWLDLGACEADSSESGKRASVQRGAAGKYEGCQFSKEVCVRVRSFVCACVCAGGRGTFDTPSSCVCACACDWVRVTVSGVFVRRPLTPPLPHPMQNVLDLTQWSSDPFPTESSSRHIKVSDVLSMNGTELAAGSMPILVAALGVLVDWVDHREWSV